MAKRYIVDLRSLDPVERVAIVDKLDSWSFMTSEVYENSKLVAADVIWDSKENFLSLPILPAGCPVEEIK